MKTQKNAAAAMPGGLWSFEVRASMGDDVFMLQSTQLGGDWKEAQGKFSEFLGEAQKFFEPALHRKISGLFVDSTDDAIVDLQGKKLP